MPAPTHRVTGDVVWYSCYPATGKLPSLWSCEFCYRIIFLHTRVRPNSSHCHTNFVSSSKKQARGFALLLRYFRHSFIEISCDVLLICYMIVSRVAMLQRPNRNLFLRYQTFRGSGHNIVPVDVIP